MLKLDIAKEMAMLEKNEKGKEYRRYLIEVEKKYKNGINPYQGLSKELRAIFITDQKVQAVESRVEKLENTMTIDYTQQEVLRELANKAVLNALGGKSSLAYKMIAGKVFAEFWRHYKRTMNVNSYKNTAVVDYEKAKEIILVWNPDKELGLMIMGANVQGCLKVV
jgi:anti-repressor protein